MMTQMEELFKLCYKKGISWENFLQDIALESYRVWSINIHGEFTPKAQRIYNKSKNGEMRAASLESVLQTFYELKRIAPVVSGTNYSEQKQEEMLKALQDDSLMELQDQHTGHTISGQNVEDMERSFLHRFPKNRHQNGWETGDRIFGRFTVNADMNPKMIKELDKFCSHHRCVYKTCYPSVWSERVDPVNVYVHEPMTEELKKEFVSIMQKYVRHNRSDLNHLLDGEVLSSGITYDKEYSYDEGIQFIRSLPPQFQKEAFNFAHGNGKKIAMSLGQRKTLEEFFHLYKQYESKFQPHINLVSVPKSKPPVAPTPKIATPQSRQPIDELTPQHFKNKNGISGIRYLDKTGNVVITETYQANCTKRVYSNGLTMHMWKNPKSTTYTDGSKTGKDATEVIVTELGKGCTKDVVTTGELKRKIEEVRKAGLLLTELPKDKKQSSLLGRLARLSVDNAVKVSSRTGGKISKT